MVYLQLIQGWIQPARMNVQHRRAQWYQQVILKDIRAILWIYKNNQFSHKNDFLIAYI